MVLPADGVYAAPEQYGPVLNETAGMMRTRYQLQVNIAVSGVFEGIEQLQAAYRQTRQLLRLAGLGKTVLFAGDAEENREQSPLEFTDSQRFYELFLQADYEHTAVMIKHAFEHFRDRGIPSEFVIYQVFWSFEQVFVRFGAENGRNKNIQFTMPVFSPQDSIEELTEKLCAASLQVCGCIKQLANQNEIKLGCTLIAYINGNISDHMLNLSGAAEHFNLSARYVQTLIRKTTGKSFFEYLDQERMKMVRTLLEESSMPVNDIAFKCGFTLHNSFYKPWYSTAARTPCFWTSPQKSSRISKRLSLS